MDPLNDQISQVELIQVSGGDQSVVDAARVSYGEDSGVWRDGKDEKLIRYLLRHNHGTPFEHNLITFRIKAPLYVVQEMLRHRIGTSFNQESARYAEIQPEFYIPTEFRTQDPDNKQGSIPIEVPCSNIERDIYRASVEKSYAIYLHLIKFGVARELARGLLPHCTYTSLYITFNLRSLLHFVELRDSDDAQFEIRQYAKAFVELAETHFPVTFKAWRSLKQIPV